MAEAEDHPFELADGVPAVRPVGPPYKSKTGGYYLQALFWDLMIDKPVIQRPFIPVFTLHEDKAGFINARKTFVEEGDPTGYKWAMKYLGEWPHFQKLMTSPWFRDAYEIWCHQLRSKQTSEAIERIKAIADGTGPASFQAAKFLANREWEAKSRRGRPTKQEVDGELKRAAGALAQEEEDLNRIRLVVNNGR